MRVPVTGNNAVSQNRPATWGPPIKRGGPCGEVPPNPYLLSDIKGGDDRGLVSPDNM